MRRVLVFGGNGGLGKDVVAAFAAKGWVPHCVSHSPNAAAVGGNIVLPAGGSLAAQQQFVVDDIAKSGLKFHAVVNVAGGWGGGGIASADTAAVAQLMIEQSVYSSVVAAHVASKFGEADSLLVLPGAAGALGATPGMVGYGMAKAAIHHLVKSIAADPSQLPAGGGVIAVLPATLDTPMNRQFMPDADQSSWTPTGEAAGNIVDWAAGLARPASGSLVAWETAKGVTKLVIS
jgi:dihydropteridine reductase